jgi:cytochrome oxidase assembly protein ShyY1
MDRAEAFMDRKEKKVEKSKGSSKNLQDRSKAWEVQNKAIIEIYAAQLEEEAKQAGLKLVDDKLEAALSEAIGSKNVETSGEAVSTEEMTDAPPIPLPDSDDEDL